MYNIVRKATPDNAELGESLISVLPFNFHDPALTVPLLNPTVIRNPRRSKNCHLTAT